MNKKLKALYAQYAQELAALVGSAAETPAGRVRAILAADKRTGGLEAHYLANLRPRAVQCMSDDDRKKAYALAHKQEIAATPACARYDVYSSSVHSALLAQFKKLAGSTTDIPEHVELMIRSESRRLADFGRCRNIIHGHNAPRCEVRSVVKNTYPGYKPTYNHYCTYSAVMSRKRDQVHYRLTANRVWQQSPVTKNGTAKINDIVCRAPAPAPTVKTERAIARALRESAPAWGVVRLENHTGKCVAVAVDRRNGERYHCSARDYHAAWSSLQTRRNQEVAAAANARRELQILDILSNAGWIIDVSVDDSHESGNCPTGTNDRRDDLIAAGYIDDEDATIPAAALLRFRDDQYARRAVRIAVIKQHKIN